MQDKRINEWFNEDPGDSFLVALACLQTSRFIFNSNLRSFKISGWVLCKGRHRHLYTQVGRSCAFAFGLTETHVLPCAIDAQFTSRTLHS